MRKLLSIALIGLAGMTLTGCEMVTVRHSHYRPIHQPHYVVPTHTHGWSGYAAGHRHWNYCVPNPHTHGYYRVHTHNK